VNTGAFAKTNGYEKSYFLLIYFSKIASIISAVVTGFAGLFI
jgi:hypothetical protein